MGFPVPLSRGIPGAFRAVTPPPGCALAVNPRLPRTSGGHSHRTRFSAPCARGQKSLEAARGGRSSVSLPSPPRFIRVFIPRAAPRSVRSWQRKRRFDLGTRTEVREIAPVPGRRKAVLGARSQPAPVLRTQRNRVDKALHSRKSQARVYYWISLSGYQDAELQHTPNDPDKWKST